LLRYGRSKFGVVPCETPVAHTVLYCMVFNLLAKTKDATDPEKVVTTTRRRLDWRRCNCDCNMIVSVTVAIAVAGLVTLSIFTSLSSSLLNRNGAGAGSVVELLLLFSITNKGEPAEDGIVSVRVRLETPTSCVLCVFLNPPLFFPMLMLL
jgi:hypothetical protein